VIPPPVIAGVDLGLDDPGPLQQMLFDTTAGLTEPAHPRPADVVSLAAT